MKILGILLLFATSLAAQPVTINGTLVGPGGDRLSGTCTASTNTTFQAADGTVVSDSTALTVSFSAGAFTIILEPNDTGVPSGTSYLVNCNAPPQSVSVGGKKHTSSGSWGPWVFVVPTSASPLTLGAVLSSATPAPPVVISWAQMGQNGASAGQAPIWTGTSWQPRTIPVILHGTGVPSNVLGSDGYYYLRDDTSCLYGPKASGAWPGTCTSLIGPAGQSVTASVEPPGANCTYGGVKFVSISGTDYACDGAPGQSVTVTAEPPGANCTYGGEKLVSTSGTNYVCNGLTGSDGQSVTVVTESPGVNCTYGGVKLTSVSGTNYVCKGDPGIQGPRGYSVLNGTVDPTASDGVDGDFWVNTSSVTFWGPKGSVSAGQWPSPPIQLIGQAVVHDLGNVSGNITLTATGTTGDIFKFTMVGNTTITTFNSTTSNSMVILSVTQSGGGGFVLTVPANWKAFSGVANTGTTNALGGWDGTNLIFAAGSVWQDATGLLLSGGLQDVLNFSVGTGGLACGNENTLNTYLCKNALGAITNTVQGLSSTPSDNLFVKYIKRDGTVSRSQPSVSQIVEAPSLGMKVYGISIDNSGVVIPTGQYGYVTAPASCNVVGYSITAPDSGSMTVEVDVHAGAIPNTTSDKISASAPLSLSSSTYVQTAIGAWTTAGINNGAGGASCSITSGNCAVIGFNITAVTTITKAQIALYCLMYQ